MAEGENKQLVENKELRDLMEVLHHALVKFVRDPQRNTHAFVTVMRHIEQRTDVQPYVAADALKK